MGAVAAIFNRQKAPMSEAVVTRLLGASTHRSLGGTAFLVSQNISLLGYKSQLGQDPRADTMLVENKIARRSITFDGRIDNRADLLTRLGIKQCSHHRYANSWLVLAAYERWGPACTEYLLGDFNFIILDDGQLFCARDPLGIRPLYYYCDQAVFVCASEIDQILAHPAVHARCSKTFISKLIKDQYPDRSYTHLENIFTLPAAHSLTVTNSDLKTQRYWRPEELDPQPPSTLVERTNEFLELFSDAVQARLSCRSTKIALLLSGGIDSSSVACALQRCLKARDEREVTAFTLAFPSLPCDETKGVKSFQKLTGIKLKILEHKPFAAEQIAEAIKSSFALPNTIIGYAYQDLFKTVQGYGSSAIFGGWGADDWMGSHPAIYTDAYNIGRLNLIVRRYLSDTARIGVRYPSRLMLARVVKPFIQKLLTLDRTLKSGACERGTTPLRSSVARAKCQWLTGGMFALNAELQERSVALYGIEGCYPYHDKRIVEFGLRLHPLLYLQNPRTKPLIRNAIKLLSPELGSHRFSDPEGSSIYWHTLRHLYASGQFQTSALFDFLEFPRKSKLEFSQQIDRALSGDTYNERRHSRLVRGLGHVYSMDVWLRYHL